MAIKITANGQVYDVVDSEEGLAALLAQFKSLVQEAVLIDGREFEVSLSFRAHESNPDNVASIW